MDSMISIEGKKYSVPPQYINTNVFYQIKNNVIEILDEHYVLICTHNKSERMINYHYQDQHYRAIASVALRKSLDVIERVCEANLAMYDNI